MILVVGGIVRLYDQTPTRQERGVMKIRLHPKFDPDNLYNDVAVLKVRWFDESAVLFAVFSRDFQNKHNSCLVFVAIESLYLHTGTS